MTARFAGSRTLDERRRRYLATNERESLAPSAVEHSPSSKDADALPKMVDLRHFPLRKVISPKAWKITLLGLSVALLGVLIVGLEFWDWVPSDSLGPGWKRLVKGEGVGPRPLFQAGLLMASGQLALIIWWGRSRSLRDFEGHYRIWLWAALALLFAGWGLIGKWHWAFSETLCWLWPARFPQREVVCWLFPACLLAGVLWKKLSTDMRECKWSYGLMVLGLVLGMGACVFRLGIDRTGWPKDMKQLATASLQMASCVAIFVGLLVHARFVIHVSAEPPKLRQSAMGRILHRIAVFVQKLPKPRLKMPALWKRTAKAPSDNSAKTPKRPRKQPAADAKTSKPEHSQTKATETHASKSAPKSPTAQAPSPPEAKPGETKIDQKATVAPPKPEVPKQVKPVVPSPPKPVPAAKTEPPKPVKAENNPTAKTAPAAPPAKPATIPPVQKPMPVPENDEDDDLEDEAGETQYRVDRPLDPGQLKGLSKKERRKLRKQHRDAQRNG